MFKMTLLRQLLDRLLGSSCRPSLLSCKSLPRAKYGGSQLCEKYKNSRELKQPAAPEESRKVNLSLLFSLYTMCIVHCVQAELQIRTIFELVEVFERVWSYMMRQSSSWFLVD
jgi:hypothetical protein